VFTLTLSNKEITSLLIRFKSPRGLLTFPRRINERTNMQAALPKYELHKLYEYTSVGFKTISLIAYLILVISCITLFISLYKMVKERAFDLAILRTYGASNFQLIKMVFYEGFIVVFSSFLLGFLLLKIGLRFALYFMKSNNQQNILTALSFQDVLQIAMLILIMVIISVSFAIYPIIKMDVSKILSNEK
jgi:putative ABC transport system permease protein